MRYPLLPILLAAGLSILSTASQAKAGLWPVEIFDVMDNQRLVVFLHDEDIEASPAWQPADGGPPLTIADVLEHTQAWIANDPRLSGAEVHEIELKPIHQHKQDHRWYYLVQLRTMHDGKSKTSYTAVLFNGKVVAAIAEPESYK